MRIGSIAAGTLGLALVWAVALPAAAGPVCNELDLGSPCVRSNDIRPSILLGGSGDSGRLRIRDAANATGVDLRSNGNVTNLFSNDEDESNGLVKAWARINADGTIAACWRCSKDPLETQRLNTGSYEVDFTPLDTDITGRPRLATISGDGMISQASVRAVDRTTPPDESTVHIFTESPATGARVDAPFVLIIY